MEKHADLYDKDFFAWTQSQAKYLKNLWEIEQALDDEFYPD